MPKKVVIGVVTSAKMKKTRVVEIPWLVKHPKYGKYLRRRTICYVHDENETSSLGDSVEIRESRPRSKSKRWELVRVVAAARGKGVPAVPAVDETLGTLNPTSVTS
jgi:small subunit ribosomal protein S17